MLLSSRSFLLTAASAIMLWSCTTDDESLVPPPTTTPPVTTYTDLTSAVASVAPVASSVTVDAGTGGSFTVGRCRLIIPANAFQTAAGAPITGAVQISLMPLLTQSDMIFRRILPVADTVALRSAGEFRLEAQQDGTALRLRGTAPVEIRAPLDGATGAGLLFFQGETITDAGPNVVNWRTREKRPGAEAPAVIVGGDTVRLFTDSTGLLNADAFMPTPVYQSFTVALSGVSGIDAGNVFGYTLYDTVNAVWPLRNLTASGTFAENHIPSISVHFVVMAVVDGKFYGGTASATPATGSTYTVTLSETTPAAFKSLVEAL